MQQNIFFMSGFPRAGTTLLMNVLAQNPRFHTTSTSGVISLLLQTKENWKKNENFNSADEVYLYPRIKSMMRGMLEGFYRDVLDNNQIPIDKNRFWANQIDLLDEIFETKVKIIFPVRNIIDCLISFEKMGRQSSIISRPEKNIINALTTVGRAENSLADDGILGAPILALREILYRKEWDRLILVPFNDLLNYPEPTLKRLYYQLELEYFPHDVENVKQVIIENDTFHGFAPNTLHKIKEGKITPPTPRDTTIFQEDFIYQIENERYKDITDFIAANSA